jgi:hypothetical protein
VVSGQAGIFLVETRNAVHVPIKEYSSPVPLYLFDQPRIFTGRQTKANDEHWTIQIVLDEVVECALRAKYPAWDGRHTLKTRPYEFARLLAKIAYATVVAELGLDTFHPLGLDIILGRSDDYFYTVGGSLDMPAPIPGGDHITDIAFVVVKPKLLRVVVEIRLFSRIATPLYFVAVGVIDLQNPQHLAAFTQHRANGKIPDIPI